MEYRSMEYRSMAYRSMEYRSAVNISAPKHLFITITSKSWRKLRNSLPGNNVWQEPLSPCLDMATCCWIPTCPEFYHSREFWISLFRLSMTSRDLIYALPSRAPAFKDTPPGDAMLGSYFATIIIISKQFPNSPQHSIIQIPQCQFISQSTTTQCNIIPHTTTIRYISLRLRHLQIQWLRGVTIIQSMCHQKLQKLTTIASPTAPRSLQLLLQRQPHHQCQPSTALVDHSCSNQKVQGLPSNLLHFPQVNLNKKKLRMKIKGTNDRNILKPFIMRTYLNYCTHWLVRSTSA